MVYNNLKLIVAVNKRWVIGSEGKMLWYVREELQLFKEKTMHSTLVIGKNTFEYMEHLFPLEGRDIIVLSSSMEAGEYDTHTVLNTGNDLMEVVKANPEKTYFIAGGAMVYRMFCEMCSEIHLSVVNDDSIGDTDIAFMNDILDGDDYDILEINKHEKFTYFRCLKK